MEAMHIEVKYRNLEQNGHDDEVTLTAAILEVIPNGFLFRDIKGNLLGHAEAVNVTSMAIKCIHNHPDNSMPIKVAS